MSKVAVLGAGAYGTALGSVLAGNGYDVDYYDPLKEKERLKDVLSNAVAVVLVLPSETVMHLLPHLPKDKFLILAAKGFLSEKPFEDFNHWGILSGAGYAKYFKTNQMVYLTATDRKISEMFSSPNICFDFSGDKKGVLMCGALKNVYAILAGRLGLKPGTKRMQKFILAASNEIGMILKQNGAKVKTLRLSCGVKDLVLTCDIESRNFRYGLELGQNGFKKPDETVEGLSTIKRILSHEINVPSSAKMLTDFLEEFKNEIKL
ncbi:hypothetical protein IKF21_00685 [Candidatus Saccharibacteria bacterium]|nr:hypothetical protein [Candidatus Saccharibacteria bacterium]